MLSKKAFGVVSVAVQMANPNGRIEDGFPRIIPGNGCGWISPYRLKRELRDQVEDHSDAAVVELFNNLQIDQVSRDRYHIFESRLKGFDGVTDLQAKNKAIALFGNGGSEGLNKYWDVRLFGGTLLESENKATAKEATRYTRTGAVQFSPFLSVLPINTVVSGLSKRVPLDEDHLAGGDKEGTGTFGNSAIHVVEHGVYYGFYSISASESGKTHMDDKDLDILKSIIPSMFARHSAQQVGVHVLQAFHFTHHNVRGSFNEFNMIEFCKPKTKSTLPSTSFGEYSFASFKDVVDFLGKQGKVEALTDIM